MFAVIGGSGLTKLARLEIKHRQVIRTPYGEPSGPLTFGELEGVEIVFIARHGYGHHLAPHEVNYRANIWALKEAGVSEIVAVNAVGGIDPAMVPGAICVPDQIIDYTHGRKLTFFEGAGQPVVHIDFTEPYTEVIRKRLTDAAAKAGEEVVNGGVYACTQGPRLETPAEINRIARDGATMVGMTGMPEAALAREAKLDYAMLAVSANHAAGRNPAGGTISTEEIYRTLETAMERVLRIIESFVSSHGR
jgi:5'-methylthioadenosine phosphorylase